MRRRPSRRVLIVNLLCLSFVAVFWLFASVRRAEHGEGEAYAAPSKSQHAGHKAKGADDADAGADGAGHDGGRPPIPPGPAGTADADAPAGDGGTAKAADPPNPIDLAVAPDGGVPRHPEGTAY